MFDNLVNTKAVASCRAFTHKKSSFENTCVKTHRYWHKISYIQNKSCVTFQIYTTEPQIV